MFSSQSEKRQSRLLTQLCVLLRILCQVFYNRTLTNFNLPHNRGHGFRKIITLQGCPNLAHHKLSRLAEVINIISSPLILGKSDQARHPGAQDISTMVKQVQQDLPACLWRPKTDVPEDSRCSGFSRVFLLCLCYLFLHCIMSSCHHVIFILHLNLNKLCGPSVHLNRGKDDFSL